MRCNLLHIGADELHYEIRAIVDFAETIQKETGQKIIMENIGDPIAAGETIPQWMKDIVMSHYQEDESYGYSPSKGLLETRQFLANAHPKKKADDIIFFNGL
ncbi:MAG: hypothetical protein U9Q15_02915 [Patescibacteria group bacterium]|nr:hypothetical protein [Patescibacteria group bacterium]